MAAFWVDRWRALSDASWGLQMPVEIIDTFGQRPACRPPTAVSLGVLRLHVGRHGAPLCSAARHRGLAPSLLRDAILGQGSLETLNEAKHGTHCTYPLEAYLWASQFLQPSDAVKNALAACVKCVDNEASSSASYADQILHSTAELLYEANVLANKHPSSSKFSKGSMPGMPPHFVKYTTPGQLGALTSALDSSNSGQRSSKPRSSSNQMVPSPANCTGCSCQTW